MKRFPAFLIAVLMLLTLCSCGGSGEKQANAEIMASYSVKATEKDFIVEVQKLGGVYDELYDEKGIYIKFSGDEEIYDKDGNKIERKDLFIGDTLKITYDGTLAKKNPKTIKAVKVQKVY